LILRSTGVGTWDWDLHTGHVAINERWAEIIGYSSKEIAPITVNTWQTYTHPDDFLECQKQLRAHWYGDADSYQTKFRMRHKSGAWVLFVSGAVSSVLGYL
jgi:PAS domain S-box-containing protein